MGRHEGIAQNSHKTAQNDDVGPQVSEPVGQHRFKRGAVRITTGVNHLRFDRKSVSLQGRTRNVQPGGSWPISDDRNDGIWPPLRAGRIQNGKQVGASPRDQHNDSPHRLDANTAQTFII
jgi:hypothetical protein